MNIKSIMLDENDRRNHFEFGPSITQIHSDTNSCGKTTLINSILYCLGFNVPSTKLLKYQNLKLSTVIDIDGKELSFKRNNGKLYISEEDNSYQVPSNQECYELGRILGITNENMLKCVPGLMYIDLKKGSKSFESRSVIGNYRFEANDLYSGINDIDIVKEQKRLKTVKEEIKSCQTLLKRIDRNNNNMIQKLDSNNQNAYAYCDLSKLEQIQVSLNSLISERKALVTEKKRLESTRDNNKSIGSVIDNLKIVVDIDGTLIPISKENIVMFDDNIEIINARLNKIRSEIKKIDSKIEGLNTERQDIRSKIDSDQYIRSLKVMPVVDLDIQVSKIWTSISLLKQEKERLEQIINEKADKSQLESEVQDIISDYICRLGLEDRCEFDLKESMDAYSGAELELINVASFLAYSKLFSKYVNINLPILIDSPGNEIDETNLKLIMNLLKSQFSNRQIVIASIYDLEATDKVELRFKQRLISQNDTIVQNQLEI